MNDSKDPFDVDFSLPADLIREQRAAGTPRKIQKRREHFVQVPFFLHEKLAGAPGQTCWLAEHLCYLHWKGSAEPIKLTNAELALYGITRKEKWLALSELEQRGIVRIERRPRKSPLITLQSVP